jgi:hypothetical protein
VPYTTNRPSYAAHLAKNLTEEEIRVVKELFTRSLLHQTVNWESVICASQQRFAIAFLKVKSLYA